MEPTVLVCEPSNVCAREEIFGPVQVIVRFRTLEEVRAAFFSLFFSCEQTVCERMNARTRTVSALVVVVVSHLFRELSVTRFFFRIGMDGRETR